MQIPLLVKKAVEQIDHENQCAFGATDVVDLKTDLMDFLNHLNDPDNSPKPEHSGPERAVHCAIKILEALESVEYHTKRVNEWTKAIING